MFEVVLFCKEDGMEILCNYGMEMVARVLARFSSQPFSNFFGISTDLDAFKVLKTAIKLH